MVQVTGCRSICLSVGNSASIDARAGHRQYSCSRALPHQYCLKAAAEHAAAVFKHEHHRLAMQEEAAQGAMRCGGRLRPAGATQQLCIDSAPRRRSSASLVSLASQACGEHAATSCAWLLFSPVSNACLNALWLCLQRALHSPAVLQLDERQPQPLAQSQPASAVGSCTQSPRQWEPECREERCEGVYNKSNDEGH